MARTRIDKNSLYLLFIGTIVAVAALVLALSLRSDPVDEAIKDDRIINIVLMLEVDGKPAATEILMYYPDNARGALLDIPGETGLILSSLKRFDRIDALYEPKNPRAYIQELEKLTAAELDWYITIDEEALSAMGDILEGFSVFIPNSVETTLDGKPAFLPSGSVVLDGRKMVVYATYEDEEHADTESVSKRQAIFQSILKRIAEKSGYVLRDEVYPAVQKRLRTNFSAESLRRVLSEFGRLDSDRIVLQRLTGTYRSVEGQRFLFPHYDGELVKEMVKQTLNALLNAESTAVADKVFTLEILNGTPTRGLAQKTAEIFQSFGYEVVSVGNTATPDVARSVIVDRYGDRTAAETVANVIRCKAVEDEATPSTSPADFIVILGDDFNGRYCAE